MGRVKDYYWDQIEMQVTEDFMSDPRRDKIEEIDRVLYEMSDLQLDRIYKVLVED